MGLYPHGTNVEASLSSQSLRATERVSKGARPHGTSVVASSLVPMAGTSMAAATARSTNACSGVILQPPYAAIAEILPLPCLELQTVEAPLRIHRPMLEIVRQVLADMRYPAVVRRRKILPADRVERHETDIGKTRNDKRVECRHYVNLSLEVLHRPERLRARRPHNVRSRLERDRFDFLYTPRNRRASANIVLWLDLAHYREHVAVVFIRKRKTVEPPAPAPALEKEPDLVAVREDDRLRKLLLRNLAVAVGSTDVLNLVRREKVGYRALTWRLNISLFSIEFSLLVGSGDQSI